jgi:hypothetical protein
MREQITDEDWDVGNISTAATHRTTLVGRSTSLRRSLFPFLEDQLVVEYEGPLPGWFQDAIASLNELARLPVNWDSYGAGKIRHSSIIATVELLLCIMRDDTPVPALVPTNRCTVQVEWHTRGIDLEVEVRGPGRLHVAFEDAHDGTEWDADISSDLSQLVNSIERLSERD